MEVQYWQHFGLTHSPFYQDPQNPVCFSTKSWEKHIELLMHLVQCSHVLLLLIGEAGCGKTTFKYQFIKTLEMTNAISVCSLIADDQLMPRLFWDEVYQHFNLDQINWQVADSAQQIQLVTRTFCNVKQPHLLVVDNAHILPKKTLAALLQLMAYQTKSNHRLHILLIGEPELSEILEELAQQENASHAIHTLIFDRFTLTETKRYLEFCFMQAGAQSTLPISDPQIARIYRESQGNPQKIIDMTEEWMVNISQQHHALTDNSSSKKRNRLFLIMSGCLLLAAGAFLAQLAWQSSSMLGKKRISSTSINNKSMVTTVDADHPTHVPVPQTTHKLNPALLDAEQARVLKASTQTAEQTHVLNTSTQAAEQTHVMSTIESMLARLPVATHSSTPQQAKPPLSRTEAEAILASIHQEMGLGADFSDIEAVDAAPVSNKQMPKATASNNTSSVSKTTSPQQSVVIVHPRSQTTPNTVTKPAVPNTQNGYVIQLIGFSQASVAKQFVQQHQLSQAHIVKIRSKGKPVYVVLMGNYPDKLTAQQALQRMPMAIRQLKPWIRSMASVQQASLSTTSATTAATPQVNTGSLF